MSFNEWKKSKLEDVIQTLIDYRGKTPNKTSFGVPLITAKVVKGGFIQEPNEFIAENDYESWMTRGFPKVGDVVLTVEAPLGEVAQIKMTKIALAQRIITLRGKENILDNSYLKYFLQSDIGQRRLKARETGTTVTGIKQSELKLVEIDMPDFKTQQRIASILSSLDDKIELNRQTNKTLETIAQTLFKEMCLPKGEELPEGWEVVKLAEIMKIKHGYAFKGEFFSDEETNDILVTPGNFKIGGGFNYSKFKYYKGEVPNDYILKENDLIVTMTDLSKEGDTLGYAALIPTIEGKKLLHNQRVGKVEFKENNSLKYFLYFVMRENNYRNFVLSGATGTTVRHTSPDRICDFTVTLPNQNILEDFSEIVHPVFDNIQLLERENQTLISLRDSLLPKLMKGEIEVNISNA